MAQVLIVEDDAVIRSLLCRQLGERGFAVSSAANGMAGLSLAVESRPDIVVLDLGLPDVDGGEVRKMLRAVSQIPVIVATARDDDASVVAALGNGADDYVVKPFSADALEARIKAVLRRAGTADSPRPTISVGELEVDLRARDVRLDGASVELTPKEFDLLAYLADRPGQVVTKKELLAEVWQQPYVHRTARAAGGSVVLGNSPTGGASITVRLPRA